MVWAQIAQAATKLVGGAQSARKANNAALQQEVVGLQDEQAAWAQNLADNEAIAEANLQNTIRTGYRNGILNIQRAQARKQAAEQGFSLGRNVKQVLSAQSANAAAAGTIGQSVDAVASDVAQKADEVEGQVIANALQGEANFDLQVHDLIQAGQDALQDTAKARVRATARANRVGFGEVLLNTALDTAGQYLSSKMSLSGANSGTPTKSGLTITGSSSGAKPTSMIAAFGKEY